VLRGQLGKVDLLDYHIFRDKIKFSSCFAHQADITTQYCNTPNDYTITTVSAMETNQSYFQFLSKIQIPLGHSMVQLEIKSQQFTAAKIEN